MHYYQDCIKEVYESSKKNKKYYHYCKAVGHNFKFDIYFYKILKNINGKISQYIYINKNFEPIIQPWLQAYHDFVLEEDRDLEHRLGKSNIMYIWSHNSLDLALIENYW